MTFTEAGIACLSTQRLARLATVGPDGMPHVSPVGAHYDAGADTVVVRGHRLAATKKFRDARTHPQVAWVADDLASTDPWMPRGIELRGVAEIHADGDDGWIVIRPLRIRSWGIDSGPFESLSRDLAQVTKQQTPTR